MTTQVSEDESSTDDRANTKASRELAQSNSKSEDTPITKSINGDNQMSDKQQFLIYVDFGEYTYKYLFITTIIPYPEWEETDERWLTFDERGEAVNRFKVWADKHIGGLNGKVVLVEPCDYVVADGYKNE